MTIKPIERVEIFDLTNPDDRQQYEDLKNESDATVTSEKEFAMGSGEVYRLVDFKEKPKANGEFDYTPPIC